MKYEMTQTSVSMEGITFVSYGIKSHSYAIPDLSTDRRAVEELVALCNRLDLSEIHLLDVAEDFVCF